jgi:hypothetical protein
MKERGARLRYAGERMKKKPLTHGSISLILRR